MRRVDEDAMWSLFDPKVVPQLFDLYGEEFERAYVDAEESSTVAPEDPGFPDRARNIRSHGHEARGFTARGRLSCRALWSRSGVTHVQGTIS
jgi:ribonucleoside-diphosphate reductase alpha chain